MTNTTTLQRLRVVGAFVLLCATPRCFGGDNTWTNSTETSAWNFTDANWTAPTKWSDVNVDGAVFDAGGVGPLTLQESVIARSLAFEVDGYSLVAPYNKGIRLSDGGVGARDPGEIHVAAGTATIDATLVGVVPVKKTGTGRLVLSRNVANSGGILIEEGTLQITGQTFSPPSISGPIVNNATLEFTHPAGLVNAGNVAGTGDLVINGGTDSVLSADDSTYTGDTYIQSGTLEVRTLATPRVYNDAVLSLSTAGQISEKAYSGVISGSGEVRVTGFGTYLLTGNNTYTGVTSVQNAKLIIGDGATSGSVGGSIGMYGDGCAVEFRRADDVVFNGSIGGSGQFIKYGSGKLTVLGNLIVTGAGAIVDEGTLIVTDGWSPHPLVGGTFAANAGAVLRFERTIDSEGYGYFITGTGQFEKAGPATMSLLEPWSFAGQTVVEAGTLRFANKSQFYLHGDIVNDGNVVFAGASQYDGVMSGSGNVTIERFESITFRGSNSYTGVTTIPARTTLSLEGPNGAIVGDVAVDGTLNFSRSTDMTYGGVVSGAGSISIDPTSRLTLTGAHIFTGRSYIYGGTLALTGSASLATSGELRFGGNGALDVSGLTAGANHDGHNFALAAGQRLTGSGHVLGDVTVRADSTISPTYSGGAITIDGTVRVEAGGEISMQVFGPGDSDSDRSQLIATGDLVLAGAGGNDYVSIVFENPNDYAGTVPATYTIAVAEDIITTTLATPITATMGGDGAGSAYDPAGLQFLAHGFSPWDRLTLSLVDNELIVDFQPALAGDFDQDGVVNGGDFLAWQRGESPSSTAASDLAVWSAHFGEVDLHGQTAGAAIPEPATVELLLLAAALFAGVFRRARSDRTC